MPSSLICRPAKKCSPPPVSHGNKSGYAQSATDSEMLDETLMSRDFTSRMTMSGKLLYSSADMFALLVFFSFCYIKST